MTNPIIMDAVVGTALADAADTNFAVHASWVPQQTPGMHVLAESELVLVDSGLPSDTFNIICRARLTAGQAPAQLHAAISYFHAFNRPFAWWVGPADQPAHLGDILVRAGLQAAESELAMAANLGSLRSDARIPAGLEIRRVQTPAELHDFAQIVAVNWTPPDPEVQRFYALAAPVLLAADSPQWLYVGYLGNQPVATAEGVVGGGVVGLYNICTREEYRRCGIGTVMTRQPLLDAQARGMRTGVLQAATAGVGLYSRLGFTRFGKITEYKPLATAPARDAMV